MTEPFLAFVECAGCGELFPVRKRQAFYRAKWCSERCRRRTLYSGTCIDCGASTYSGSATPPTRCNRCNGVVSGVANRERALPRRTEIERLWAEGKSAREIAQIMRLKTFHVAVYRARGYNLPHRRTAEQVARIREGRWGARAAA